MWIEVNLAITLSDKSLVKWRSVVATEHIISLSLSDEPWGLEFCSHNNGVLFETGTEGLRDSIFKGWMLALQGKETKFEGIGFIRPLLANQIEETYKFLQYQNLLNSMRDPATDSGGWLAL